MQLSAIEIFLTLSSDLHFGRAAERLHLSQASVSRSINALERSIGGALFERTSRRVSLTPLGVLLRDSVGTPYAALRTALEESRTAARGLTGTLRVGTLVTTAGPALTRLVEAFEFRSRNCRVEMSEVDMHDPYAPLRENEIDVLISWLAVDERDLVVGPAIDSRPRMLAVAAGHDLAKRRSVSIEDIADYALFRLTDPFPPALHDAFAPPFTPSGKPMQRTVVVRRFGEAVQQVALGRIVHPTVDGPAVFRRPDIVLVPIRDMPPLPLGLIWWRPNENQRIRAFARTARRVAGVGARATSESVERSRE